MDRVLRTKSRLIDDNGSTETRTHRSKTKLSIARNDERLGFLINGVVAGVADNGQAFCGTLSTEGQIQLFKRKKAQAVMLGLSISGGVDGTRTRDPRRDRPVF